MSSSDRFIATVSAKATVALFVALLINGCGGGDAGDVDADADAALAVQDGGDFLVDGAIATVPDGSQASGAETSVVTGGSGGALTRPRQRGR